MLYVKKVYNYILCKYKWGKKCKFGFNTEIDTKSTFEGMSQIHPHTYFKGKLGFGSYIGSHSCLSANIGKFTSIAPYVRCNIGTHPYTEPYVTTSPCFFSLNPRHSQNGSTFADKQLFDEVSLYDKQNGIAIKIGSDCWIGEGAFFAGGIKIGDGAVVLAHAVVTKDIPPYAIVGGVPAKIIKYRYDKETIEFLLKVKWWNNSLEWFKKHWELLNDINKFKRYYEQKK